MRASLSPGINIRPLLADKLSALLHQTPPLPLSQSCSSFCYSMMFQKNTLVCSFILLMSVGMVMSYNYCKLFCKDGKHTMCQYPVPGPNNETCKNYNSSFTEDDKHRIVDLHNRARSLLAEGKQNQTNDTFLPPAANMMQLEWDDELAAIAQRWSEQCAKLQRDKCRSTRRFNVGQSIMTAYRKKSRGFINNFLNSWFKEAAYVPLAEIRSLETIMNGDEVYGHYTQAIWATTRFIGCAHSEWDDLENGKRIQQIVCNYGPIGNIKSHPVYKRGEACSRCPSKTTCSKKYPGLCTKTPQSMYNSTVNSNNTSVTFNIGPKNTSYIKSINSV